MQLATNDIYLGLYHLEEVERGIPVFPYWFATEVFEPLIDFFSCALVGYRELFEGFWICVVTARVYL